MAVPRLGKTWARFAVCALILLAAGMVVPHTYEAFGRKTGCDVRQVFLQDVSIRRRSGVDTDEVLADYQAQLETVLSKKKMVLVDGLSSLGSGDVALRVSLRAWTDRTQTHRALLSLAATLDVDRAGKEIWSGDVSPGEASKLLHAKNSDPENLAKKTVDRLLDACRSGWSLRP